MNVNWKGFMVALMDSKILFWCLDDKANGALTGFLGRLNIRVSQE